MSSCGDTTPVGAGLVDEDEIKVEFSEDFVIGAKTVLNSGTVTFSKNETLSADVHYAGEYEEPGFGRITSSFYFQNRYFSSFFPDFADNELDSLVMTLQINPTLTIGDSLASFNVEVYRLIEDLDDLDSIPADSRFMVDPEPLGMAMNIVPGRMDTVSYYDPTPFVMDTVKVTNVVRIALDQDYAEELFNSTDAQGSDENLVANFNGYYIKVTTNDNALMAFDLPQSTTNNNISMSYTIIDGDERTPTRFDYLLGYIRPLLFEHDYVGTPVIDVLQREIEGDDLGYIQGFSGPDIELDLTDILKLSSEEPLINYVSLEVTVATEAISDIDDNPVAQSLGLYTKNENGVMERILDLQIAETALVRESLFGGFLETSEDDSSISVYKMNLTGHVKEILRGLESPILYLSVWEKRNNPTRTVIYGPQHSNYPMKLSVTYTKS